MGSAAFRACGTNGECFLHNGIIHSAWPNDPQGGRGRAGERGHHRVPRAALSRPTPFAIQGGRRGHAAQENQPGAAPPQRGQVPHFQRAAGGPGLVRVDRCTGPGQFVTEQLGMMTFDVFHPHTQELIGSSTQFPFHLAYAVTVHKLQGLEVRAPHPCPHTLQSHGRMRISTRLTGLTLARPCSWKSCGWTAPRFATRASSTQPCRGSGRGRVSL